MPIKAIIGRPRQGKSYSVVKNVMLPAWKAERTIVTNIPLKGKAYEEFAEFIIYQPEIDYHNIVNGAIYVIDEIWKDFPAGVTQAKLAEHLRYFLAMHAHTPSSKGLTTEIVVVTQNLDQIATAVTSLIETTYYVEKIKISEGIHKCRTNEYNGSIKGNPPKAKPVGSKLDSYEDKIFEYYKSHTGVENDEGILEMDAIKSTTFFGKPMFKYGFPLMVITLPFVIYWTIGIFKSMFSGESNGSAHASQIKTTSISSSTVQKNISPDINFNSNDLIAKLRNDFHSVDIQDALPLSKNKRITGSYKFYYGRYRKEGVQISINNIDTIDVSIDNVLVDKFGESYVVFRNEIVTRFTGEPVPELNSFLPDGLPAPSYEPVSN